VVIVDTSGSMDSHDSRGGKTRYQVACDELAELQRHLPGKIAVISFSSDVQFCPSGCPLYMGGGTDLAKALQFTKIADLPGMKFIVISDGQPDEERLALQVAATYQNKIDVIYVGPETSPSGRNFLQRLAEASGGQIITADRAQNLLQAVEQLLLKA
jgi:Mg-chelatase subunit ChlD